jgi:hypothetical protein
MQTVQASLSRTTRLPAARPSGRSAAAPRRAARMAPPRASNVIVEGLASTLAIAVPVAVGALTAEDTDKEIARLQTPAGLIPLGAAVAADAVAHSIPGEDKAKRRGRRGLGEERAGRFLPQGFVRGPTGLVKSPRPPNPHRTKAGRYHQL